MKQLGLKFAFGGLAAGLLLLTAQPSFATVSGELLTGGNGTLTISATSLTFTPNDTTGYSTEVAAGTDLMFAGCSSGVLGSSGCLTQGEGVDINGGDTITSLGPITDFLTFATTSSLVYSLTGYDAGSTDTDCAALTIGESCSVFAGSPVILTKEADGTAAALGVYGTVTDGSGASNWTGEFTATVNHETPQQLQAMILAGEAITHTHSGDFTVTSAVPEPRLISLAALAALFLGLVVQKRRKIA
ncbi:MAG TPA: hypothetical protein VME17_11295 [Bryobacteraceae bacterium]|nr:hypothetical protein [Bryobacteraceae bacterium]